MTRPFLLAALLLATSLPAMAQPAAPNDAPPNAAPPNAAPPSAAPQGRRPDPTRMFNELDTNRDGRLTMDEMWARTQPASPPPMRTATAR